MEENYDQQYSDITPSDQMSEIPMTDCQGKVDSIFL